MKQTFLFYDIETTGLNPCFDQILQFAAIRTDLALNELERHEILVKLNIDVVPSPEALITHNISLKQLESGISEYEAVKQIHRLVNEPGTISLGYNTLGFDDEFLRFAFYRNLLPPYTHQYVNFCSRADIYPMTILYYLFKHNILNWPEIEGKVSLKLENLSNTNQLAEGAAHDAMVDVKATVALAKKLKQEEEMWHYLLGFFNKKTDSERASKLGNGLGHLKQAILIDGKLGADNYFHCPVLGLGQHNHYHNQTYWLRLDRPELVETTPQLIAETTWAKRKKFGEPGILLPATPRFMKYLNPERQAIIAANKSWLNANVKLREAIINYYREFKYPSVENLDTDAALYEIDFPTQEEEQLCKQFHRAKPEKKAALIDQMRNTNMRERAVRIMGRHFPNYLPDNYLIQFEEYLASLRATDPNKIWQDFRGNLRLTPSQCCENIDALTRSIQLSPYQLKLLDELTDSLAPVLYP